MFKRLLSLALIIVFLLAIFPPSIVSAQPTVPVTVTIWQLIQIDDPDSGKPLSVAGDFFAKVRINGFDFQTSSTVSIDPGFGEGVIFTPPVTFYPFWTFTRNVDLSPGTAVIEIQIWDEDDPGFPLFDDHDHVDINPIGGVRNVILSLDLTTGNWTGDVPANQTFTQGGGDSDKAKIFFDISIQSTDGDADGDGLLDGWEARGLDADGDGTIDVNLPSFGADPMHKDLFLELDWMAGNAPTRAQIQAVKTGFANAPINAGTNASSLTGGANSKNNPDGLPGINLWVDTGNLADGAASEDGAGLGTCGDSLDNGGDGATDGADSDCLVGDNLGGGNQIAASAIPALDSSFYTAKNGNFNLSRRLVFRYGISAAPGFEDGSAAGNSCFDGADNGGGDENGDGTVDFDGNDPDCWPWGGGWGEIGGNDFIEYNDGGNPNLAATGGTIMHEFGHTLNLRHGGNVDANCKPNYVSVMNYDNQFGINQIGGGIILDYSPPRFPGGRGAAPLPQLGENNLNEATILDNTDATNRFVFSQYTGTGTEDGATLPSCNDGVDNNGDGRTDAADPACYQKIQNQLNQRADWNGDGDTNDPAPMGNLTANIDISGNGNIFTITAPPAPPTAPNFSPPACTSNTSLTTLSGFDDWTNISLPFRQFGDSADGAKNPVTEPEITLPELLNLHEMLNTTDVEIMKDDSTDPTAAGEELIYTIEVINNGPNPASDVQVVDTLPSGVSYLGNTAGCVESPSGTLTCDLGELLAGESHQFMITVLVDADLVYNAGGPTTITNNVTVENLAGPDPESNNNSASEDTLIVAIADLEILSFSAVGAPDEVLVAENVDINLKKVIDNNGPSAPMDVELTKMATAPADSTVSPGMVVEQEIALGLDEEREVIETFTINCGQASQHTFNFTNEIQPLNPEDTDPDLSNNTASFDLDVECVVPVTINIKPGSDPNSINPRSRDVVSVAVLSTPAGEYGNPLAFDATTIDPLSVRFGPRDDVWSETAGAFEAHDMGHLEDSLELDEVTMDGDLDMVLHFRVRDTGIESGDIEACVKGEWLDPFGNVHKFFGCDVIRTVGR